ncbi:hypothetical protein [uncultured Nevskia sp.]|uniref:hypothetical protein n=1 Tax=uncultured Nevskia sp. TaxID=228950 RepID=UPI0025D30498|nr:hypothetical protein [uncultured Nevskia sp.]
MNDTLHWRLFNFLARRVVAPGFVVVGFLLAAFNIPNLFPGGTVNVDGIPSNDIVMRLSAVVLPLFAVVMGVAMFMAKPYRPPEKHKHG